MIISASRRTDIPTYYSDWFTNRIKEGFVLVRNPISIHQISKISLSPDVVDGIVFWTKNPIPMLDKLNLLKDYSFYFQFTITPYGKDVEPNIPSKPDVIIPAFQKLSDLIGAEKVVWRYDPIMLNTKYTMEYHVQAFEEIASQLSQYTKKCTISFVDFYRNTINNVKELSPVEFPENKIIELSKMLADIAHSYNLKMDTCAEKIELQQFGIEHARCIDDRLFEKILGCPLQVDKDKNQRLECGCISSIDIGMYNTCKNGCRYCYANFSDTAVKNNTEKHNPSSPLLFGEVGDGDIVKERIVKSCKDNQIRLDI